MYAGLELSRTDDKGELINTDNVNLSADELIDFWQNGVLADMAEGHIARRTVCDMERGWSYTNAQLYLCITGDLEAYQQSGGDVRQQQWLNVQIATDSVHCLDWIEEHTGVRPAALNGASAEEPVRVW